ncbi:uncharacterized protein K452DRAFT_228544 [Aplosporella prunicola CBS 121167]|uniref:GED domain-containing protein n=1 Tax=Aplosporella prunicola CBS 121167 TaxID=1176127 RepID=A0A6A6BE32_9PEZI|nr:uncharacterized protein K452DRAFT_228544 [Aplosporella prunicola CBS 121167]KAF2141514.1 hypothetical protein K452DRAFT_228544 [Aplosporella prunicola CBS 121167]
MLAEDTTRLEKIDELYALRLDRYVSLPQLVVVGDQSSGKSSVLEGLTALPFPRDSGLCTRFPTQIVFKRSPEQKVDISIIQSDEASQLKKPIPLFETTNLDDFNEDKYLKILSIASQKMGISGCASGGSSFSDDTLKIELSGPRYEHFSVIDLPGIFRKPTPGQTTKEDIALVRQMIDKRIRNPRSIILAVIPANVDIATQEIIQMAEDVDPRNQRTLGVLTKPDLVDKGAEHSVLDLINGKKSRNSLGYTVVCNRSQSRQKSSLEDRNTEERAFFESSPWCSAPKDRTGISALQKRLDKLLVEVTRQNFRAVTTDVYRKIQECERQLEQLGSARQSAEEQRAYLTRISSAFQVIATKSVDGYYSRDRCFKDPEYRLATVLARLNEDFSQTMFSESYSRHFTSNGPPAVPEGSQTESKMTTPSSSENDTPEFPELDSIMLRRKPEDWTYMQGIDIISWIRNEFDSSKGFDVATINPSLLPTLFLELSKQWENLAFTHVEGAIGKIHKFLHNVLHHVCEDPLTIERLWAKLRPSVLECYQRALAQVTFLDSVERNGKLITLNHYFADNLRKRRLDRVEKRLRSLKSWVTNDDDKEPLLRLRDTLNVFVSNDDQTVEDMHDILKSYYKVALKRFIDTICMQAVDYYLISGPVSPLSIFSPEFVSLLPENELEEIAGERSSTTEKRASISKEIATLRAGKRVLDG